MRYEEGGLVLWYGTGDAPAPSGEVEAASGTDQALVTVTAGVQPPSASNSVQVTYRVNGGSRATVPAALLSHDPQQKAQYYIARLPAFRVGEKVEYLVVGRAPGRQVPGPQEASKFAASFEVVPDPPAEASTASHPAGARSMQLSGDRLLSAGSGQLLNLGASIGTHPGAFSTAPAPGSSPGPQTSSGAQTSSTTIDMGARAANGGGGSTGGGATAGPAFKVQMPISLRRIPFTIDPLSEAGNKVSDLILPFRLAGVSKFYFGIDRIRLHLGQVTSVLATRTLPGQLIGVVLQPDGTAGRLLQIQFDPSSLGSTSPKGTVVTHDSGSFKLVLPRGVALPDSGLSLTVHGSNGNATVTLAAAQIAANGLFGSVTLPTTLNPLPVSILTALTALLPATPPAASSSPAAAPQLHVVKLGEDDSCQLAFRANNAIDKFPYGIFFRLVEPQTSIPHVALNIPGRLGFLPVPNYRSSFVPTGGAGDVTYVDRVPIEQPLSVDGFRDEIIGATSEGTVTAEETVPMAGSLGLGYTLWMSQRWTFQGLALGDLVYSLALAPGEQQQVAIFERVDTATVKESEFFTEEETQAQSAVSDTSTQATFTSAFNEAVNGGSQFSANASSSSWSAGGSAGFSLGPIALGGGGGGGGGSSSSSGQSSQYLDGQRNTTQQAAESTHSAAQRQAAARRSAAHTSMRMATASESQSVTTKVITNHNHTRALTLQYWEVLRLYDVTTAIDGLTLTCLVPMQVVRFLPPGQSLTLSDPSMVSNRPDVMARYSSIIKHADVLARVLPRQFRYGLTLLQQFAADPTAEVEPFGGVAEDVIQFTLSGTFLPCEDVYIRAVTKRNTRVGPVKLANSATIPPNTFASQDELLASLSGQRQSNNPTSLTGSLALPPSLNRSDIIGFEFSRSFRQIDYALIAPETALVNTFNGLFPHGDPPFLNAMIQASVGQTPNALVRTTIHITPGELESALGGPFLFHFWAGIEELDASGNLHSPKGESYANDSLNGIELPTQTYPVPAVQIGPVLRFNQILEIEQMTQHVVRNTISYSKAIWGSMSADERAIFLEHYTIGVPSDGIADTSQMVPLLNCVENRVLGFFGNSMMMPFLIPQAVAEQMNIDPAQLQSSLLAYQQAGFAPPQSTIALPTRGVLGEAVLGSCPSAEKIDLTRFWNWADSPADTAPAIAPVTLPTTTPSIAAGLTAPNTLTNLPSLINNVLTAPTPDTSLLQALSKAAASQQDFSPTLTGADKLASLLTSAQTTAGSALSDAVKANTQLVSQALTGAVTLASQQNQQSQQGGKQDQSAQGQPGQPQPQTQPDQQSQQPQTQPDQQNQQPPQGPGAGQGLFQLASYQPGSGAIGVSSASGIGAGPTSPTCVTADASASGGPYFRACCALECPTSLDPTAISGHVYAGGGPAGIGKGGPTG